MTCINVKLKDYSLGQVCLTTGLLVLITSFAFLHSIPILLPVPRLGADQTHLAVHTLQATFCSLVLLFPLSSTVSPGPPSHTQRTNERTSLQYQKEKYLPRTWLCSYFGWSLFVPCYYQHAKMIRVYCTAQIQVLKFLFKSLSSHDSDLTLTFLTPSWPSPDLNLDLSLTI